MDGGGRGGSALEWALAAGDGGPVVTGVGGSEFSDGIVPGEIPGVGGGVTGKCGNPQQVNEAGQESLIMGSRHEHRILYWRVRIGTASVSNKRGNLVILRSGSIDGRLCTALLQARGRNSSLGSIGRLDIHTLVSDLRITLKRFTNRPSMLLRLSFLSMSEEGMDADGPTVEPRFNSPYYQ
ncbi:unnamed protein product [Somion occarium]|uniref:Uncharacterized protein n=1 Tax=Somion occarium TaxID=3059160 RepID=A0ABP1CKH7_9APHY